MRIAVIGAGLAGLAAADALAAARHEPVVLEARERVGGRAHSVTLDNGAVVEMGAEFILPGCTEVLAAAERFGLGLWDKGMRYGSREPRGVEVGPGEMEAAVATVAAALAADPERVERESVKTLLERLELPAGARAAIEARAEVSAAAQSATVPAAELALLARVSDDPAPTIAGGNGRLAEAYAAALPVGSLHLGEPVRAITASADGIRIATAARELEADACVAAVPQPLVTQLGLGAALGPERIAALDSVAYGEAAKLFVPLRAPAPPSATLSVPDRYWAWTATGPGPGSQPVVSAFAGSGAALAHLGVAHGPERWLGMLTELRDDLELDPEGVLLSRWDDDPWARGAYSVSVPAAAAELLREPFGPGSRLVLAGEYLGGGMSALMEGAIRSGTDAVSRLEAALETPAA